MAPDSRSLLHHTLIADIVELSDLMEHASHGKAADKWITTTLTEAPRSNATRTDPSLSDHSVDRSRPRRRDEPSSGRGAPKQAILRSTSDSDSGLQTLRRVLRKDKRRQVRHCIYHAPGRDDSDRPRFLPFPPDGLVSVGNDAVKHAIHCVS